MHVTAKYKRNALKIPYSINSATWDQCPRVGSSVVRGRRIARENVQVSFELAFQSALMDAL